MTNTPTEARLADIAAEYGAMADGLPPQLEDGPGAASAFYMSCSLGEVASMARELLSRRSLDDGVEPVAFDMIAHLARQREWSGNTFGPGPRTAGVIDHIRKELREIEADPSDITEWIDVVILALDGAWRAGYQPQEIIDAMVAKQTRNEGRNWPDWRTMSPDKAIEHDRSGETAALSSKGA